MIWFFAVLGVLMGSAANALIDRLPRNESWVRGRSKCDKCAHVLEYNDLFPIFSYLLLKGKCRYCKKRIPVRNLVVEVLMGLTFVVIWGFGGGSYQLINVVSSGVLMAIAWVTIIIAVIDWETRLVSELMCAGWMGLVVGHQVINNLTNFESSLMGLLVGLGMIGGIWAVSRGKAMGFGDVEIAIVMGWWLKYPTIWVGLWVGFVSGAIVGVYKLLTKKAGLKSEIAFGPFLILGSWVGYLWGDKILAWVFRF